MGSVPQLKSIPTTNKDFFCATINDAPFYLLTHGEKVENSALTAEEVDKVVAFASLKVEDSILDLCCGNGRHSIELARRGYASVTGVDNSIPLIGVARARQIIAFPLQNHPPPTFSAPHPLRGLTFYLGDGAHIPFITSQSFDKVLLLGNTIAFLSGGEEEALQILREATRLLVKGGKIILEVANADYARQNIQAKSWTKVDPRLLVCRESVLSTDSNSIVQSEIVLSLDKGFLQEHTHTESLISNESISQLLGKAGFINVQFDSKQASVSQQSFLVTAEVGDNIEIALTTIFPVEAKPWYTGKGIFATRDINAGEVVQRFSGPIMPYAQVPAEEIIYVIWVAPDTWLIPITDVRFINHFCDPNCDVLSNREVIAIKPIKKGEQLSFVYNISTTYDFWDEKWTFECKCGASNCQKIIGWYIDKSGKRVLPPQLMLLSK